VHVYSQLIGTIVRWCIASVFINTLTFSRLSHHTQSNEFLRVIVRNIEMRDVCRSMHGFCLLLRAEIVVNFICYCEVCAFVYGDSSAPPHPALHLWSGCNVSRYNCVHLRAAMLPKRLVNILRCCVVANIYGSYASAPFAYVSSVCYCFDRKLTILEVAGYVYRWYIGRLLAHAQIL